MKRLSIPISLLLACGLQAHAGNSASRASAVSAASAAESMRLSQDIRLLVRPKASAGLDAAAASGPCFTSPDLAGLAGRFSALPLLPLYPGDPAEGTWILRIPRQGLSESAVLAAYRGTGRFHFVESDGVGQAQGARAPAPNDSWFNIQWGLANTGKRIEFPMSAGPSVFLDGKAGADIGILKAWEINAGSDLVLVAVLDGGLDVKHPDIAARVWVNGKEVAGNGVDDDGNGFIDDVNGWNFANEAVSAALPGNGDVRDVTGHGTNVASIIGAIGNNGSGIAGAARCRILPVRVLNNSDFGLYSWWAAGIRYAVAQGAKVINMSLCGSEESQVLREAVQFAVQRGVVVLAAMGNLSSSAPQYPARIEGAIAVSATGPDDRFVEKFMYLPQGSNHGQHVSVCAPGNGIAGLLVNNSTGYGLWTGTSQATPLVAGICALLIAQNPSRTPAEIRRLVEAGAVDQVGDSVRDTPGFDTYYGHGRVSAERSLLMGMAVAIRPLRRNADLAVLGPSGVWARDALGRKASPGQSGILGF